MVIPGLYLSLLPFHPPPPPFFLLLLLLFLFLIHKVSVDGFFSPEECDRYVALSDRKSGGANDGEGPYEVCYTCREQEVGGVLARDWILPLGSNRLGLSTFFFFFLNKK